MSNKLSFIHLIRNPMIQYTTFKIVFSNISNFVRLNLEVWKNTKYYIPVYFFITKKPRSP